MIRELIEQNEQLENQTQTHGRHVISILERMKQNDERIVYLDTLLVNIIARLDGIITKHGYESYWDIKCRTLQTNRYSEFL